MSHPLSEASWLNPPSAGSITAAGIDLVTAAHTDFWQRTFYGFRCANAPAALIEASGNITFSVRALFSYRRRYDQAGVLVWIDDDNWFKASVEHEDAVAARLGSVLTTAGYSDWATRDIAAVDSVSFRLSRRGPDFLLEAKTDDSWEQLRVFHMAALGITDPGWASLPAASIPAGPVRLGVYACSPEESSFAAQFDQIAVEPCTWGPHT